jgi:hypothetical protein
MEKQQSDHGETSPLASLNQRLGLQQSQVKSFQLISWSLQRLVCMGSSREQRPESDIVQQRFS